MPPLLETGASLREQFGEIDIYLFDQLLRGRLDHRRIILDAGCGGGRNLVYLANAGFPVYGVDRDPAAIAMARHRLAPEHSSSTRSTPGAHLLAAELDALPFESQKFDAVICSAVLHFAADPPHFNRILDELWRVLAPGGILFARLASLIGLEASVTLDHRRRATLPDGTERFLVDAGFLADAESRLNAVRIDPLKTTIVEKLRCMTTWVLQKP